MSPKINTNTIRQAAANVAAAGQKAHDKTVNVFLIAPVILICLAGVLDYSGFWNKPLTAQASAEPNIGIESKYTTPPETVKESSGSATTLQVEATPETPAVSPTTLQDTVKSLDQISLELTLPVEQPAQTPVDTSFEAKMETCKAVLRKGIDAYRPNGQFTPFRDREWIICKTALDLGGDWRNARWVVAVAIPESSLGRNASNGCNAWGWGPHIYLGGTWEECLANYTKAAWGYMSQNSIDAYLGVYCQSACTDWEPLVRKHINIMQP